MTRPDEFTVYQATDPGTSPAVLEQMAGARPDLRQFVAANPSTAPEVLGWLGGLGDPAVTAALARRPGAGTSWTAPAHGGPGDHVPPPSGPPAGYGQPAPNPYAAPGQGPSYGTGGPGSPYPPPALDPYVQSAGGAYGQPQAGPYGQPAGAPYGQPQADPYAPRGPYAGGQAGYVPSSGDLQAAGYGYQPQQGGSRKGIVVAIAVGAVVLIGALIFAASSIFSSLGGSDFGDDPELDQLWDACAAGDASACDDLYWESPLGSDYEEFGDTCGSRQPAGTGQWCTDVM